VTSWGPQLSQPCWSPEASPLLAEDKVPLRSQGKKRWIPTKEGRRLLIISSEKIIEMSVSFHPPLETK
jgi:hypothetical protein